MPDVGASPWPGVDLERAPLIAGYPVHVLDVRDILHQESRATYQYIEFF